MSNLKALASEPRHVVAIFGGAVSGSEAAVACAERGVTAIVFEQNDRPYGKIEDGLPRWHDKLRDQEYARINENLSREGVFFVPRTKLGRDLDLKDVAANWGLSAVVLANGAWRDRALPVAGAEAYLGKGLVEQNAFVYWFNHYDDRTFDGTRYEVKPNAIVVGGGLASVDVCKIINVELARTALKARGVDIDVVELEHKGVANTLQKHGIDPEEVRAQGATLYYRRRVKDMPVAFPKNDSPEQVAKTEVVREKMVGILRDKFLIKVQDQHVPSGLVVEDGRLVGLKFKKSEVVDGKARELDAEVEIRSGLIVSSIGSVPERVPGVPTKGDLYDYASWDTGAVQGMPGVFGLGNVLTGKGNIKDSRSNSREITEQLFRDYLGVGEPGGEQRAVVDLSGVHDAARTAGEAVAERVMQRPKMSVAALEKLIATVQARWNAADCDGDYTRWIEAHRA